MKKMILGLAIAIAPTLALAEKDFTGSDGDWDCGKDPSVYIMRGQGTFTIKGACTLIALEGGENKLNIESVDTLKIVGGDNTIEIGTVDSIKIVGAGNKLTWKKAKAGAKPKISSLGANSIEKAK